MNALQQIVDSDITNLHLLGRQLQTFCRSDAGLMLLPGHGYLDGGCFALARALTQRLQSMSATIWVIEDHQVIQHAVCRVSTRDNGALFLDGDGVGYPIDVLRKMTYLEHCTAPCLRKANHGDYRRAEWVDYQTQGIPAAIVQCLENAVDYSLLYDYHRNLWQSS